MSDITVTERSTPLGVEFRGQSPLFGMTHIVSCALPFFREEDVRDMLRRAIWKAIYGEAIRGWNELRRQIDDVLHDGYRTSTELRALEERISQFSQLLNEGPPA